MFVKSRIVLMPLAAIAAALLSGATPALATPVEVTDPEAVHCPELSFSGDTASGGCEGHVVGSGIRMGFRFPGFPFSYPDVFECDIEATLRMDEDGNAAVTDVAMTNCESEAGVTWTYAEPCAGGLAHAAAPNNGEEPWRSAAAAEETATDSVTLPLAMCFVYNTTTQGDFIDCEGVVPVEVDTGTSPYTLTTSHTDVLAATLHNGPNQYPSPGSPCWIEGTWSLEGEPFTITHLE